MFNSDVYDNWVNPWVAGNGSGVQANGGPLHGFAASASVVILSQRRGGLRARLLTAGDRRYAGRRARSAAASVPSSRTSSAPPIGTPCPTRVTATLSGFSRSVNQCAVVAPSTVAGSASTTSATPPSRMRSRKRREVQVLGPDPAQCDKVPPST